MSLEVGKRLGHYEVTGVLGTGGMGEVYRARDLTLHREVAIKILPAHVAGSQKALGRFEKEAVVLAQLSHPNILAIHDFGDFDGTTLAVMELLEGESLRSRMEKGAVPVRQAMVIASSVAEGLAAAHSKGVIHRDLKPENIFLTSDGQVKILDFGLARMDWTQFSGETTFTFPLETDPKGIRGTVGYMAPEQLQGKHVDARTDIFSLGCVLYELLTERRAFSKATPAETLSAILNEHPPDFIDSGRIIPAEAEDVTNHCLEKDPNRRYQSARDLALHLKTITSSIDLPGLELPGRLRRRNFWSWVAGSVIVLLIALTAFLMWQMESTARLQSGRPSVAVMYFENHTGDPAFDWLRTALPNMLVTDLSQSTQIEVLSTDRLYHILEGMGKAEDETNSFEVIQQLAKKARVNTVVLGSLLKAGDVFRLDTRLQDAVSGRILATERVEGNGEPSLFQMVDETTKRIKTTLEISAANDSSSDRQIREVTTSSVLAYRHYMEGDRLHIEGKESDAIPLLEEALKADPQFAMAAAKLSAVHFNLGHPKESYEYAAKAIELADRLPAQERYYVEGRFYSLKTKTLGQAIEAYQRAINLYPTHTSVRHNLANLYFEMERFDEATAHYEELVRRGSEFAGTFANLALCYAALGKVDEGVTLLRGYLDEHPDHGGAWAFLGDFLLRAGKLDDSAEALQKAELLAPGTLSIHQSWMRFALVRSDWVRARHHIEVIFANESPHWQFEGHLQSAILALYQGDLEEALKRCRLASSVFADQGPLAARALVTEAVINFQTGNFREAARLAEQAQVAASEFPEGQTALFLLALSKAGTGDMAAAAKLRQQLLDTFEGLPATILERETFLVDGRINSVERNWPEAVSRLTEAEKRFPETAMANAERVSVRYYLGLSCYESGNYQSAVKWFQQVVVADSSRANEPILFVRSHYYLGECLIKLKQPQLAAEMMRKFLSYWSEAQFDRSMVRRAQTLTS